MKKLILITLTLTTLLSCTFDVKLNVKDSKSRKKSFTTEEQKILKTARAIIDSAYYGTLITLNNNNEAKARIMEPFAPDKDFTIYLATNPKSRKVSEIEKNAKVTLHYFDKKAPAYVSLYGTAIIINNDSLKKIYWKKSWEHFYNNRKDAYMLLKFIPDYLELISIPEAYTGDEKTWLPTKISFIKNE